jgi:hypothetical protein
MEHQNEDIYWIHNSIFLHALLQEHNHLLWALFRFHVFHLLGSRQVLFFRKYRFLGLCLFSRCRLMLSTLGLLKLVGKIVFVAFLMDGLLFGRKRIFGVMGKFLGKV